MNCNSTLLIDISPKGKIKIIDLNEIINLDNYFADVFSHIENSNLQPPKNIVEKILNDILI